MQYNINETYFDVIDTPNKAYILGVMFADGSINKFGRQVILCTTVDNKVWLEDIRNEIGDNPIYVRKAKKEWNQGKDLVSVIFSRKRLCQSLISKNCVPDKTHKMQEPVGIPDELISHFIRGYYDGDGCISWIKRNNVMSIYIVGPKVLAEWLYKHLNINDISCHLCQQKGERVFRVVINNQVSILKFMHFIYKDAEMYLPIKKDKYLDMVATSNAQIWTLVRSTPL
jgi:hypothetical protein